jgi:hypothetical protein
MVMNCYWMQGYHLKKFNGIVDLTFYTYAERCSRINTATIARQ